MSDSVTTPVCAAPSVTAAGALATKAAEPSLPDGPAGPTGPRGPPMDDGQDRGRQLARGGQHEQVALVRRAGCAEAVHRARIAGEAARA